MYSVFGNSLLMTFIPLFVAVDPLGLMPVVEGLMTGVDKQKRHRIIVRSILAALIVGVFFLFLGRWVLYFLGITVGDFKVAGGVLLFIIALKGIISSEQDAINPEELGVVPLGVPLIAGPAVLTSLIILYEHYGLAPTLAGFAANLIIVGALLWFGRTITKLLGTEGAKVLSKVAHLLLAAFAIMMIRLGVVDIIDLVTKAG